MNEQIDNLKFKSYYKLKNKFSSDDYTQKQLQETIKERLKDPYPKHKKIKKYMMKIYSSKLHTWFMDIFDNTTEGKPRYWLILIGTNNRFACAYPLNRKNSKDVIEQLTSFLNTYRCTKITSDEESSFKAKETIDFLEQKHVSLTTVPDKNHSTLGIIDRFIRTLRDMNTPRENDKLQSDHKVWRMISVPKMRELLNIYNNTYHISIKCSPKEMMENSDKENKYIDKCRVASRDQKRIKDFHFKIGDYVRFITPKDDKFAKRRSRYTTESYKITGKDGNYYILMAADGTIITKTRFQLIKTNPPNTNEHSAKWGHSLNTSYHQIISILAWNERTKHYLCLVQLPDNQTTTTELTPLALRGRNPQIPSDLEKEFWEKHST